MTRADSTLPPCLRDGKAEARHAQRRRIWARIAAIVLCLIIGLGLGGATRSAAQETDLPVSCLVGVDILTLHSFNAEENTFDAGFWIWSVCPNDQFKPLETMEIVNANTYTLNLQGETVMNGLFWSFVKVEGTFRYFWDLTHFPFDRHTLEIHIENSEMDASGFIFEPDTVGSAFEPDMPLSGWDVAGFNVGNSISTYETTFGDPRDPGGTSNYSRFSVGIDLDRKEFSGFILLTFVVYLAFLLSLVSYFINLEAPTMLAARLGVNSGALFAVAVNLHTTTSTLGAQVGLTLVGMIHVVTMVAIVLGAVGALGAQVLVERGGSEAALKRYDRKVMLTVVMGYILVNILLIGSVALKYW